MVVMPAAIPVAVMPPASVPHPSAAADMDDNGSRRRRKRRDGNYGCSANQGRQRRGHDNLHLITPPLEHSWSNNSRFEPRTKAVEDFVCLD